MLLQSFIISLCLCKTESLNASFTQGTVLQHSRDSLKTLVESASPTAVPLNIPGVPRKIVGGHQCNVEKYPFIISLRRLISLTHFCAGTLIRPDWVLTAGHCVAPHITEPKLFTAIAGISKFNQLEVQRRRVNQILVHPEFDENNFDNDISLIRLEHSFIITELVKPISIPNHVIHGDLYSVCPEGITIGYGWHNDTKAQHLENDSIPHVLVMQCVVNLPVLSDKQCQNARAGLKLRPNTFCTMAQTGENICQGDSGGPLLCNDMQFGIVSSGYNCNFPDDTPGYYTRIDRVLNFIKECMSGNVNYYRSVSIDVADKSLDIKQNTLKYLFSFFYYLSFSILLL